MSRPSDAVVAAVHADAAEARAVLEELVRIPSISADPARTRDVEHSADATAALLEVAGLERVREAAVDGSPPAVIGEWVHRDGAPTILLYAHHDVQPPGIVANWTSDPFEPVVARRPHVRPRHRRRQGRRGRARVDDQGVARHRGRAALQREGADRG